MDQRNIKREKNTQEDILSNLSQFIHNFKEPDEDRLPQRAYYYIRHAIRNLILPPGRTILEREIAEVLEMSRTPVREALIRLETDDALRIIPRRGFIVEPIEKHELLDVYQIIGVLEGLAAQLAAKKINEMELAELDRSVNLQEEALEQKNIKEWAILDNEFHYKIVELAGNPSLNNVIDTYGDKIYRARLYTIDNRPVPLRSIVEHKAMIACLRAGDGTAARYVMESHRNRAQQEILGALDEINHH